MFIYRHTVQRGDGQLEPAGGEMVKQADPLLAGRRESLDAVGRASIVPPPSREETRPQETGCGVEISWSL